MLPDVQNSGSLASAAEYTGSKNKKGMNTNVLHKATNTATWDGTCTSSHPVQTQSA